jgi:hypothetical protein
MVNYLNWRSSQSVENPFLLQFGGAVLLIHAVAFSTASAQSTQPADERTLRRSLLRRFGVGPAQYRSRFSGQK